ncbi:hypothetical protein LMB76_05025 [Limosilactobacillus reuteri]|uniref:Major facilitator superfamily (MFS) profile domain-containing protein n=3 Tax=Limosilactobacillus reuteri TaxID=1598 RepID=A0AAW4X5C0_LIMRT|nr:hypothetical protein [Limosilactobacillus reuteri]MCC4477582.1 hypothetical protein [Limosilactobacillus reuteri]MCC4495454.1 hypothetical protein [Limosilactobacillus reuteri]MCC4497555.1 hypothetical protein [Limosilactobacillus reuteri]
MIILRPSLSATTFIMATVAGAMWIVGQLGQYTAYQRIGVSLLVARLTFRFSNAAVLISGAIIDTLGLSLGAIIGIQQGYWLGVALPMVFIGIGQRLIMSPLTVAGVANTSGDIAGAASRVVNTVHQIGGAVGLSIVSEMVAGIASPATMIDHAQMWMVVLAVIMLIAGLNILRGSHKESACLIVDFKV